ncbi:hypothetical protein J22TS3_45160 [Paenibacillus sp. J22TS3]|nr:hypothetical protein J22TS3_45160 [Paenibacillus sp. J22TS3]
MDSPMSFTFIFLFSLKAYLYSSKHTIEEGWEERREASWENGQIES